MPRTRRRSSNCFRPFIARRNEPRTAVKKRTRRRRIRVEESIENLLVDVPLIRTMDTVECTLPYVRVPPLAQHVLHSENPKVLKPKWLRIFDLPLLPSVGGVGWGARPTATMDPAGWGHRRPATAQSTGHRATGTGQSNGRAAGTGRTTGTGQRAPNNGHRTPRDGHRAQGRQSNGYRATGTGRAAGTEQRVPDNGHRTPKAGYRAQSTGHRATGNGQSNGPAAGTGRAKVIQQ